jgi:hypothetical protein
MLINKWSIYENYQAENQKIDYKDTIQKVCDFSSLEEISYIIKKTLYGKPRAIFTDL